MKIPPMATGPLAISPSGLRLCLAVLTRGEVFTEERSRAAAARADAGPRAWPASTPQVDVVPIQGPIARHAGMMSNMSGATSYDAINASLDAAAASPARAVLLAVDSPGGQWHGGTDTAAKIRALAASKPVIAHVSGEGASAAYYLTSAASRIIASRSAELGSVGVRQTWPSPDGETIDIVSSGAPGKNPDPTTDAGRAQIKSQLDALESVMVADIAAYRGTTPEAVRATFGAGGVLVGEQAVAVGMADEIGTIEDAMRIAAAGGSGGTMSTKVALALGLPETASEDEQVAAADGLRAIMMATGASTPAAAMGTIVAWKTAAESLPGVRAQALAEAEAQASRDREATAILNSDNGRRTIVPALLESYFPTTLGAGGRPAQITVDAAGTRTVSGVTVAGLANLRAFAAHAAPIEQAPDQPEHEAVRVGDGGITAEERAAIEKIKERRRADWQRSHKKEVRP